MNKTLKLEYVQELRMLDGKPCTIAQLQLRLMDRGYKVTEGQTAELVNKCILADSTGYFEKLKGGK